MRRRLRISHTQISSLVGWILPSLFRPVLLKMGVAAQEALTRSENREKESISRLFEGPGLNQRETWFPTLSKTVWVLSQLHDYVQARPFHYTVTIHKP
jgi:hypothetical protein